MFQFIMVLILDGYLEGFGELDDPVINRNCRLNLHTLHVAGEVADVGVNFRFCAAVAV